MIVWTPVRSIATEQTTTPVGGRPSGAYARGVAGRTGHSVGVSFGPNALLQPVSSFEFPARPVANV